jgi:hypothetical protein
MNMKTKQKSEPTYRLIVVEYQNDKHQYPEFPIFRKTLGDFPTQEEAYQAMNEFEANYEKTQSLSLYGFTINEVEHKNGYSVIPYWHRQNATPDDVIESMGGDDAFRNWQDNLGLYDLVEVLHEDKVTLEMIPKNAYMCEVEEDGSTYAVLNHSGPKTIQVDGTISVTSKTDIYPPRFPVDRELIERLKYVDDCAYKEFCDKVKNKRVLANYTSKVDRAERELAKREI